MNDLTPEQAPPVIETRPRRGRKRPAPAGRHTLSGQLRETVRSWGLPTSEIARRSDIDPKILGRFLNGSRGLTLATVDRLAEAFGLQLGERLGRRRAPGRRGKGASA